MRPLRPFVSLLPLLLAPGALAKVKFTTPAAGSSVAVGTIDIAWEEAAGSPSISQLKSYQLQLMVGGNTADTMTAVATLTTTGLFSTGNSMTGTISAAVGGDTTLGYFLCMIADGVEGGTLTTYSERFSLTGMTGTSPDAAVTAVDALDGSTKGPAEVNDLVVDASGDTTTTASAAAVSSSAAAVSYESTVEGAIAASGEAYSLQTAGSIKYAPMQSIPPHKITKTATGRLYPTSSFSKATTYLAIPQFVTTYTAAQTFSVESIENTIAAAAQPSNDKAKFLRRWQD